MDVICVLLSWRYNGFWMSTLTQHESTCTEGEQWAAMEIMSLCAAPTGEEDPGPDRDGCASCSQIKPTISHKHIHTDSCMYTEMSHTHARTLQSALCLDSLTENHQGNWTLIALCASLALHVALSNIKPTKSCDNNNNVSFLSTFFQTHEHLVILEICSQIPDNTFSIQTKKTGFLKSSHLQQVAPGGL